MNTHSIIIYLCGMIVLAACSTAYAPESVPDEITDGAMDEYVGASIDPGNLVRGINHPYFTIIPGTKFMYESLTEDGTEVVEVYTSNRAVKNTSTTARKSAAWYSRWGSKPGIGLN